MHQHSGNVNRRLVVSPAVHLKRKGFTWVYVVPALSLNLAQEAKPNPAGTNKIRDGDGAKSKDVSDGSTIVILSAFVLAIL